MDFTNSYQDKTRAKAYVKLEFANTYYLAFRDLPEIFRTYVTGKKALDFGCGTGRSTRFLQTHGFTTVGIDISKDMINHAKRIDPEGYYHLISDGDYSRFKPESFDLILSAFTFDNIPMEKKTTLLSGLARLLQKDGTLVNIVSSPEMYTHEWVSFSTRDFPENKTARTGDVVPIITTDFEDKRPCYDVFCTPEDYKIIYQNAGLQIVHTCKPIATGDESYTWINETHLAPWIIFVLKRNRKTESKQ